MPQLCYAHLHLLVVALLEPFGVIELLRQLIRVERNLDIAAAHTRTHSHEHFWSQNGPTTRSISHVTR